MAQQTKSKKNQKIEEPIKEPDNKKEKFIKIGVVFVFLVVLIILLVTFCHRKDYAVTFMVDGKEYRLENVRNMGEIVKPKAPTKEGYTFKGWYVDGKEFDFETGEITGDMQLEAQFTLNVYTVTISDGLGNKKELEIEHGKKVEEPETPTKKGYNFLGWYLDDEKYDFDKEVTSDMQLEARFSNKGNAIYTVEYYLMGLDGKYPTKASEKMTREAQIDSEITPTVKSFKGFTSPKGEEITVLEDGSAKVKYYYPRNRYSLTVKRDKGILDIEGEGSYYYGEKVDVSVTLKEGYEFVGWSSKVEKNTFTMPANKTTLTATTKPIEYKVDYDLNGGTGKYPTTYNVETPLKLENPIKPGYTFKHWLVNGEKVETLEGLLGDLELEAVFEVNTNTPYKVEHYYMDTEGNYPEKTTDVVTHEGTTDTSAIQESDRKVPEVGFTFDSEKSTSEANIDGNGTTVVKYYYQRTQHTVTLTAGTGVEKVEGEGTYYYGKEVKISATPKAGYTFEKWSNENTQREFTYTVTDNLELTATATPNTNTSYKVEHYYMDTDGNYPETTEDVVTHQGTTDTSAIQETDRKIEEGFTFDSEKSTSEANIDGNGTTVVKYYYQRTQHTVTLTAGTGVEKVEGEGTYYYGKEVKISATPKAGYTFEKWSNENTQREFTYTVTDNLELTATATPNTNTSYKVEHYYMDTEGNYPETTEDVVTHEGTTDTSAIQESDRKVTEGFTFDSEKSTSEANIDGNGTTVVKYYYSRNQHTLTVSGDTGVETPVKPSKEKYYYKEEVQLDSKDATYVEGYEFDYWLVDNEKVTGDILTLSMKNSDVSVSMVTKKIVYHLTYISETDQEEPEEYIDTFVLGETKTSYTPKISWLGHHFTGWYEDLESGEQFDFNAPMKAGDITLYAKWELDEDTIAFVTNKRGLTIAPIKADYGTSLADKWPEDPTYDGYTFEGWYSDNNTFKTKVEMPETMENSMVLYAKWRANKYTITFDKNGGEGQDVTQTLTYDQAETPLTTNSYTKTGYHFVGWSKTKETPSKAYDDNAPVQNLAGQKQDNDTITLYAMWEANNYEVKYDPNGGSGDMPNSSHTYDKDGALSENTFTKEGYHFKGWTKDTKTNTLITENKNYTDKGTITVYAVWEANTYTVTFNANKGVGEDKTQEFTYDAPKTALTENTFTREGYTFDGWSTEPDGDKVYSDQDEVQNLAGKSKDKDTITLYAHWVTENYTITYKDELNAEGNNNKTSYNIESESITLSPLTKTGYTFLGWYKTNGDSVTEEKVESIPTGSHGNLTLAAKWKEHTYKVVYTDGKDSTQPVEKKYTEKFNLESASKYTKNWKVTYNYNHDSVENKEVNRPLSYTNWKVKDSSGTTYQAGTEVSMLTAEDGATITLEPDWINPTISDSALETPTRTGYTFKEWQLENKKANNTDTVTKDITLIAEWTAKQYTVTYESNNGKSETAKDTFTFDGENKTKPANIFTKSYQVTWNDGTKVETGALNATLTGWKVKGSEDGKCYDPNTDVQNQLSATGDGNVTLEACWADPTITHPTDERKKTGYKFGGWYTDVSQETSKVNDGDAVTSELTLHAKWTPITYKVVFTDGNGKQSSEYTYTYDGKNNVIPKTSTFSFTKSYKVTFKAPSKPTGVTVPDAMTVSANIKEWKVRETEKTYNASTSDKTISDNLATEEGTTVYLDAVWNSATVDITGKNAEKKGYTFKYWMIGDASQGTSITLTSDIDLTAKLEAITYKVKYNGTDGQKTKTCTYDKDCPISNYQDTASINVKLYNDGKDVGIEKQEVKKAICKTAAGGSCEQDGSIEVAEDSVTVKNLASTENAVVTIQPGLKVTFPEVTKEDCVFGGWSKSSSFTNDKDNIIGYHLLDDEVAEFTGQYEYATEYEFTEDTNLYARWWDIPYIESVGFELYPISGEGPQLKPEVKVGHVGKTKKTSLYVKIPSRSDYYVDVFTLAVSISQPVRLNNYAKANERYPGDISVFDASTLGKETIGLGTLPIGIGFTSQDAKNWSVSQEVRDSLGGILMGNKESFNGAAFPTMLKSSFLGNSNLGVTKHFGCNGLACSPRYESILYEGINGAAYYFFATEDVLNNKYTINYKLKVDSQEQTVYTFEVPVGTPIPNIGNEIQEEGGSSYTITKWTTEDGTTYDFDSNVAEDSNPACKNKVITIVGHTK